MKESSFIINEESFTQQKLPLIGLHLKSVKKYY